MNKTLKNVLSYIWCAIQCEKFYFMQLFIFLNSYFNNKVVHVFVCLALNVIGQKILGRRGGGGIIMLNLLFINVNNLFFSSRALILSAVIRIWKSTSAFINAFFWHNGFWMTLLIIWTYLNLQYPRMLLHKIHLFLPIVLRFWSSLFIPL